MYIQKIEVAQVGSDNFHDLRPYLAPGGFEWRRIDIDVSGSTTLGGRTHTVRIREKQGVKLTFRGMKQNEISEVLGWFKAKYVLIRFVNPETQDVEVHTMKTGNAAASHQAQQRYAVIWKSYTIDLEEF